MKNLIFMVYPIEGSTITSEINYRIGVELAIQKAKILFKEPYRIITTSDIAHQTGGRGGFGLKIMAVLGRCDDVIFIPGWEHSPLCKWIFDTCEQCNIRHFVMEEDK